MTERRKIAETKTQTELLNQKWIDRSKPELVDELLESNRIIWGDYAITERRYGCHSKRSESALRDLIGRRPAHRRDGSEHRRTSINAVRDVDVGNDPVVGSTERRWLRRGQMR